MKKLTLEDCDWRNQQTVWCTVRESVRDAVHLSNTIQVWLGATESILDPVRNTIFWSVCNNIEETIQ